LWYSAGPPYNTNTRGIGFATSPDGINWTRDDANPVLQAAQGTWEEGGIWTGDVLFDGRTYHMWYTAGYLTSIRTGYATAPVTSIREFSGNSPAVFTLAQNYPNPFNPVTNIEFQIPGSKFVILKIFNVLGEEVANLVNEAKPAGRSTVTWNAAGFSNGVYFYRLQAGGFSETRKLILMK
jgi:hypothetical protein